MQNKIAILRSQHNFATLHFYFTTPAKGGVGKSSVSTQTALGLLEKGLTVGLLDVDLCGPSIPRMIGIEGEEVHKSDGGLVPVLLENDKLKVRFLRLG